MTLDSAPAAGPTPVAGPTHAALRALAGLLGLAAALLTALALYVAVAVPAAAALSWDAQALPAAGSDAVTLSLDSGPPPLGESAVLVLASLDGGLGAALRARHALTVERDGPGGAVVERASLEPTVAGLHVGLDVTALRSGPADGPAPVILRGPGLEGARLFTRTLSTCSPVGFVVMVGLQAAVLAAVAWVLRAWLLALPARPRAR